MKAIFLFLLFISTPSAVLAQESHTEVISRSPTNTVETVRSAESFRLLEMQVRILHRAARETMPLLGEVMDADDAAVNPRSTGEALTDVLGTILRGDTNQSANAEPGRTNLWGSILRGVLGTNQFSSAQTNSTSDDLALLRAHLRSLTPVLDRLASGPLSTNQNAAPPEESTTDRLLPTGRNSEKSTD